MGKFLDGIFLSDHEWKKKYCPTIYNYLFVMSNEDRHNTHLNYKKWCDEHRKICPDCHGIYFDTDNDGLCLCKVGKHCIAFEMDRG